ncbi:hypothetical protein D9M72_506910 [compost metagenome]
MQTTVGHAAEDRLGLVIQGRVEQRPQALVHFAADERLPFHDAVAHQRTRGRHQVCAAGLVAQVLANHRPFAEGLPVVQLQQGHVALGVAAVVVVAVRGGMGAQVDFFQVEGLADLAQDDMHGK